MAKAKKTAEPDLDKVLGQLRRSYGKFIFQDNSIDDVYPTGLTTLDTLTEIGGFPGGRMVELFGGEGSGKSSLSMLCASQVQKQGKMVLWVDFEHCFMSDYANALGMSTDQSNCILLKPLCAEEGFDAILRLVHTGTIGMVVIDSVAAANPSAEVESDGYSNTRVGLQSLVITGFVKKLIPVISEYNTLVIFINQLRSKIQFNSNMPSMQTTPGGMALKFYATMRVRLQSGKAVRRKVQDDLEGASQTRAVAHVIRINVVKNKVGIPFRSADVLLVHGKGFRDIKPKK